MADDQEKSEENILLNEKGTSPSFYASRYGTKEKFIINFCEFF
jgi:hypothetical protein